MAISNSDDVINVQDIIAQHPQRAKQRYTLNVMDMNEEKEMPEKYVWAIDKMITPKRVKSVARSLFADDFHEGDCENEHGRVGLPCGVCKELNEQWEIRLAQVKNAMAKAFS